MSPEKLIKFAEEAQKRAYAPYSNYLVGSALLTDSNKIILGCNIESKAYPTTLCAERVAIFSALAQGFLKFSGLAVITKDKGYPCGGCLQIIHEYVGNVPIYIASTIEDYSEHRISQLLPYPFG
tara:strand:- start:110 stop:481 length:372 start_codon:yes stop_codon:yes gene_type:complete